MEQQEISKFSNDEDAVIKSAGKGGAAVIL